MSNHQDILTHQAVCTFADSLGDMVGAPFVDLHDVMDPNQLVDEALASAASQLGVRLLSGDSWLASCNAVADLYEKFWVLA